MPLVCRPDGPQTRIVSAHDLAAWPKLGGRAALVGGWPLSGSRCRFLADYRELLRDGVQGETVVIARDVVQSRNSDGDRELTYYLSHQFRPEGYSGDVTAREAVSPALYKATEIGDLLPVTYIWNDPERNTLDPKRDVAGVVFFRVGGGYRAACGPWGHYMGLGARCVCPGARCCWAKCARRASQASVHMRCQERKSRVFVVSWTDAAGVNGKSLLASAGLAQGACARRCDRGLCGPG